MGVPKGYRQTSEHVRRRMIARLSTLKAKPRDASRDELYALYVVQRLTCPMIAKSLSRDPKTIWEWLKHYQIPTRPRGSETASRGYGFQVGKPSAWLGRKHTAESKERFRQLRLADGHVPYLKNGVHHLKGKSGADTPNWRGGVTPARQSFYQSEEWRSACVAVWKRDNAMCRRCAADHRALSQSERGSFHVHHIISFMVVALRAEPTNLVLLCADCHRFVHSRKNTQREFLKDA